MGIAIKVKGIWKKFSYTNEEPYLLVRDIATDFFKSILKSKHNKSNSTNSFFWALKDINFNIQSGETVGIIGHNGAGKSTLLKILSRITPPSKGEAIIDGKVSSLLEVGTGFNSELTGRENIFLNGALLGMSIKEISQKFDQIVEFAEIGKFLDTQVKHYSSGMHMKLAFSVAAHLSPQILIIDEVLAVGDLNFQKKSFSKIKQLAKSSNVTLLLVSHNLDQVNQLCSRCIVFEKGAIAFDGSANKAINYYLESQARAKVRDSRAGEKFGFVGEPNFASISTQHHKGGKIGVKMIVRNKEGKIVNVVKSGQEVILDFSCSFSKDLLGHYFDFGYNIETESGAHLVINYLSYEDKLGKVKNRNNLLFQMPRFPFAAGTYNVNVRFVIVDRGEVMILNIGKIQVVEGPFFKPNITIYQQHSPMYSDGKWEVN